MGMGGDAKPLHVGLIRDGAQLLLRQLLLSGRVAARENAAGGADLDHFRAELALTADLILQLVRTIADAFFLVLFLHAGRQERVVAMASGRAKRVAGGNDPRPNDKPASIACLRPDIGPVDVRPRAWW
jgi:hypothetical protein